MKQLFWDQLGRHWMRWLIYSLVCALMGYITGLLRDWDGTFVMAGYLCLACFGFPHSVGDLPKGYGKVALTLPLATKQIGYFLWFLTVIIPAGLLTFFGGVGICLTINKSCSPMEAYEIWVKTIGGSVLIFGSAFWIFSAPPGNSEKQPWPQRLPGQLYGSAFFLFLVIGAYFLYQAKWPMSTKLVILSLVGLFFTILGWFRAPSLATDYGALRPTFHEPSNPAKHTTPPRGAGGIMYAFQNSFATIWGFGILYLIVTNIVNGFTRHQFDWHHLTRPLSPNSIYVFLCFFICFNARCDLIIFPGNFHHLRTLPISTNRLAAFILAQAILPLFTLCLTITLLAWHENKSMGFDSWLKIEFIMAAAAAMGITISIWNTHVNFTKVAGCLLLAVGILAPAIYEMTYGVNRPGGSNLSIWFVIPYAMTIFAFSYWSLSRILAQSSSPYERRKGMSRYE